MKTLIKNGDFTLCYIPSAVNRFVVYKSTSASPSGNLVLKQEVARSAIFTKHIKSYFTPQQVQHASAIVHGIAYANRKFKA